MGDSPKWVKSKKLREKKKERKKERKTERDLIFFPPRKKGHFCAIFRDGQRSVTAAWATRSPWSIFLSFFWPRRLACAMRACVRHA